MMFFFSLWVCYGFSFDEAELLIETESMHMWKRDQKSQDGSVPVSLDAVTVCLLHCVVHDVIILSSHVGPATFYSGKASSVTVFAFREERRCICSRMGSAQPL